MDYTLEQVCRIAHKLVVKGMGLKHAVNLTAAAYGFDPDVMYIYMSKHGMGE